MSVFSRFYEKEPLVNRTYEIDETLYVRLEELSKNKYDASINKLVNASIEELLKKKNVAVYSRLKSEISIVRTFCLRESIFNGLVDLRDEYSISFNRLVNIAIRNALVQEGLLTE